MKKWMYPLALLLLIISALAGGYKYNTGGETYSFIDALDKIGFVSAYLIIVSLRSAPTPMWAIGRAILTLLLWGLIFVLGRIFIFQNLLI